MQMTISGGELPASFRTFLDDQDLRDDNPYSAVTITEENHVGSGARADGALVTTAMLMLSVAGELTLELAGELLKDLVVDYFSSLLKRPVKGRCVFTNDKNDTLDICLNEDKTGIAAMIAAFRGKITSIKNG